VVDIELRRQRAPAALGERGRDGEGESVAAVSKKAKSAAAAANPLISLETAKEKIWKKLGNPWKKLGNVWKSLDFPWKGLEKFGPIPPVILGLDGLN
jgi:hypothetical protein